MYIYIYICIYTYIDVYIYVYTCVCIYIYTCVYIYVYMYICIYVYTHRHTHTHTHTYIFIYTYIYIKKKIVTCMSVYIHTYTHTPTRCISHMSYISYMDDIFYDMYPYIKSVMCIICMYVNVCVSMHTYMCVCIRACASILYQIPSVVETSRSKSRLCPCQESHDMMYMYLYIVCV